jgi:hypothetical protein
MTLDALAAEVAALRAQVQDLAAREEIRQLTCEYMQAMHDARWEDAVACFSEEAQYDHGILGELRGLQDIRHFYTKFMPLYEEAGGWSFDVLADPGHRGVGRQRRGALVPPDTAHRPRQPEAGLEYRDSRL